jgi:hypothetical protein
MTLFTKKKFQMHIRQQRILYTGYFTNDNEPNGTKNAPHNQWRLVTISTGTAIPKKISHIIPRVGKVMFAMKNKGRFLLHPQP